MSNPLSPADLAVLRVSVLTVLGEKVKAATTTARQEASELLKKGDGLTALNPANEDEQIAKVTKTKPKKKAEATDRKAVDAWIVANYPDKTETKTKVIGSHADVLDVLREHAPFLIEEVTEVPDWAVNELLLKSSAAGQPVGFGGEMDEQAPPGITVSTPDGSLRVTVSPDAESVVERMWAAGLVDLDGNTRELTAGGEN